EQQGRGTPLLAPPAEHLLSSRKLARCELGQHAQNVEIGKPLVVFAGSPRAVKDHRNQPFAKRLLQPLHKLSEQLFDVHAAIYQSLEAPPPLKSPPPNPPKLSPES